MPNGNAGDLFQNCMPQPVAADIIAADAAAAAAACACPACPEDIMREYAAGSTAQVPSEYLPVAVLPTNVFAFEPSQPGCEPSALPWSSGDAPRAAVFDASLEPFCHLCPYDPGPCSASVAEPSELPSRLIRARVGALDRRTPASPPRATSVVVVASVVFAAAARERFTPAFFAVEGMCDPSPVAISATNAVVASFTATALFAFLRPAPTRTFRSVPPSVQYLQHPLQ
mmetsp:Transcript_7525/g.16819  ORF Transcript_7525/g.16819 Transcript_7525/m.16819 type:complete len:228 (+) Transcript_7525:813-1496(+)